MNIPFFDYKRQLKKIKPEINKAINSVLDSGRLILGPRVEEFENNFAKFIGVKYGIGVNSGTDAIKIASKALGIKNGDEIITVANTAVPTISAVRETGAIPKFVDIKNDYTIDENKIENKITKKTRAILVVHLYGHGCNMQAITKIAKKNKLKIIEDCAQASGTIINNKKAGSLGDISCFSFYPTKNLGAYGDAGIILTKDKKLAKICKALRMYGMIQGYHSYIEGYNSRLDEMQAAILNVKLKYLNKWVARRRQIAKYYIDNIINPKIILPESNIKNDSFHLFVTRTKQRNKFLKFLAENKIGYGIHYDPPVHLQKAYKSLENKKGSLPFKEKISKEIISLPIFPELTNVEIKHVVNTINKFK